MKLSSGVKAPAARLSPGLGPGKFPAVPATKLMPQHPYMLPDGKLVKTVLALETSGTVEETMIPTTK
jgi:hypothetical protein